VPSRFRLSLAHATLLDLSPPELIRAAAAAGFEAVGLRLNPVGLAGERRYALEEQPRLADDIRRALDDTGIRFLDVEVVRIHDQISADAYAAALEGAAALGARFAIVNVYSANSRRTVDELARLCELGGPAGLTMLVEPVSFSDVSTVAGAIGLVRACGAGNAGVLVDTLHLHSAGEPLAVLDELSAARAPLIHLCDGPAEVPANPDDRRRIARAERLLPGEGGIDLQPILQRLPPGITYAVEAHNPARAAALGAEAYARLAFQKTVECLSKIKSGP